MLGGESPSRSSEKRENRYVWRKSTIIFAWCISRQEPDNCPSPDDGAWEVDGRRGGKVVYFFSSAARRRLFDGFRAELSGPGKGQSGDRKIRLDLIAKARPVSPVDARQKVTNALRIPGLTVQGASPFAQSIGETMSSI